MHEYYQGLCGLVTSEPAGLTLHLLNSHTEIMVKYSQHPQHFIFQHLGGATATVVPLCDACVGFEQFAYFPLLRLLCKEEPGDSGVAGTLSPACLCTSSLSDTEGQTLTRFLCFLNKTPIKTLCNTVTGSQLIAAWRLLDGRYPNGPLCVCLREEPRASAQTYASRRCV